MPGLIIGIVAIALVIVAFGAASSISGPGRPGRLLGALIVLVGVLLTAEHTFGLRIHFWRWWPLFLIAAGVLLIARAREGSPAARVEGPAEGRTTALLAGVERRISAPDFRHAEFTAIMGGIDVDLRSAQTATGEAVIDVFALMGGVNITVPADWAVVNQITPILGGVEDSSTGTSAARHRVILRGYAIMGGIEIRT